MSYLEIYNNVGYDLLHEDPTNRKLEDLPKVKVHRGADGGVEFSNLKSFHVENEEDMLNLLFIGDTNRVICQTPLNDVSTRSHCMFMVSSSLTSREPRAAEQREDGQQAEPGRPVGVRAGVEDAGGRAGPARGLQHQPVAALSRVRNHAAQQGGGQGGARHCACALPELAHDDGAEGQVG